MTPHRACEGQSSEDTGNRIRVGRVHCKDKQFGRHRRTFQRSTRRDRRGKNAIIFNLPESGKNTEKNTRRQEDEDRIVQILSNAGNDDTPLQTTRFGNFNEGKARPIKVTLSDNTTRDSALKAIYKAAKEDADKVMQTSMRKDLSAMERVADKVLQTELKAKKEVSTQSGNDRAKWTAKKGQIVNVGIYPHGED